MKNGKEHQIQRRKRAPALGGEHGKQLGGGHFPRQRGPRRIRHEDDGQHESRWRGSPAKSPPESRRPGPCSRPKGSKESGRCGLSSVVPFTLNRWPAHTDTAPAGAATASRPAQHEQRAIQHRAHHHPAHLGRAEGRQLQRKGGGHSPQHRGGQQPGKPQASPPPPAGRAPSASAPESAAAHRSAPAKNRVSIRRCSVGKRPLQGTRALVSMAISRSRGLSMMRQPVTPAGVAAKAHAHGQRLLAAGMAAFESIDPD